MHLRTPILVALLALIPTGFASAQVSVTNEGFEADPLGDGAFTINTFAAGWITGSGGNAGAFNPTTSAFSSEAPEGLNVAYSNGRIICQTVGTVANNDFYSTSALAGVRLDVGGSRNCGIELRSTSGVRCRGEANPAPIDGFSVISCNFTAAASDIDDGEDLDICLTTDGVQCNFDTAAATPVELQSFSIE